MGKNYRYEKIPYEKSFAHHIEVELGLNLDDIWNWKKNNENGINPYKITKCSTKRVWLYCLEHDYHNYDREGNRVGYEITCFNFIKGRRCSYCSKRNKVHPKDSFAQWGIDTFGEDFLKKYWSSKNTVNPWSISKGSTKKVWLYCLEHDYHNYDRKGNKIGYEIKCDSFYNGCRCGYCKGQYKIHWQDSLAYNFPYVANMIAIPKNDLTFEDCFEIACKSNYKFYIKCLDCGTISDKKKKLSDIVNNGYSCKICSDGLPITEKFMANILNQLEISFQTQLNKLTFNWCKNYEYDFYIPSLNMIIETHGEQHYKEKTKGSNWRGLEKEQANDRHKKYLAKKNGIKRYYSIDCKYSRFEYMKKNIIKTLGHLFDLSKVNWNLAWEKCQNSLCVEAWELWNSGIYDTFKIGSILNTTQSTVIRYLKRGKECGKCNYTKEESRKIGDKKRSGKNHHNSSKVICITTKEIFDTITEGAEKYNLKSNSNISACCIGIQKSAGKLEDGTPLVWRYINIKHNKILRGNDISKLHSKINQEVA